MPLLRKRSTTIKYNEREHDKEVAKAAIKWHLKGSTVKNDEPINDSPQKQVETSFAEKPKERASFPAARKPLPRYSSTPPQRKSVNLSLAVNTRNVPEVVYSSDGRKFFPCHFCCRAFAFKKRQVSHMEVCIFRKKRLETGKAKSDATTIIKPHIENNISIDQNNENVIEKTNTLNINNFETENIGNKRKHEDNMTAYEVNKKLLKTDDVNKNLVIDNQNNNCYDLKYSRSDNFMQQISENKGSEIANELIPQRLTEGLATTEQIIDFKIPLESLALRETEAKDLEIKQLEKVEKQITEAGELKQTQDGSDSKISLNYLENDQQEVEKKSMFVSFVTDVEKSDSKASKPFDHPPEIPSYFFESIQLRRRKITRETLVQNYKQTTSTNKSSQQKLLSKKETPNSSLQGLNTVQHVAKTTVGSDAENSLSAMVTRSSNIKIDNKSAINNVPRSLPDLVQKDVGKLLQEKQFTEIKTDECFTDSQTVLKTNKTIETCLDNEYENTLNRFDSFLKSPDNNTCKSLTNSAQLVKKEREIITERELNTNAYCSTSFRPVAEFTRSKFKNSTLESFTKKDSNKNIVVEKKCVAEFTRSKFKNSTLESFPKKYSNKNIIIDKSVSEFTRLKFKNTTLESFPKKDSNKNTIVENKFVASDPLLPYLKLTRAKQNVNTALTDTSLKKVQEGIKDQREKCEQNLETSSVNSLEDNKSAAQDSVLPYLKLTRSKQNARTVLIDTSLKEVQESIKDQREKCEWNLETSSVDSSEDNKSVAQDSVLPYLKLTRSKQNAHTALTDSPHKEVQEGIKDLREKHERKLETSFGNSSEDNKFVVQDPVLPNLKLTRSKQNANISLTETSHKGVQTGIKDQREKRKQNLETSLVSSSEDNYVYMFTRSKQNTKTVNSFPMGTSQEEMKFKKDKESLLVNNQEQQSKENDNFRLETSSVSETESEYVESKHSITVMDSLSETDVELSDTLQNFSNVQNIICNSPKLGSANGSAVMLSKSKPKSEKTRKNEEDSKSFENSSLADTKNAVSRLVRSKENAKITHNLSSEINTRSLHTTCNTQNVAQSNRASSLFSMLTRSKLKEKSNKQEKFASNIKMEHKQSSNFKIQKADSNMTFKTTVDKKEDSSNFRFTRSKQSAKMIDSAHVKDSPVGNETATTKRKISERRSKRLKENMTNSLKKIRSDEYKAIPLHPRTMKKLPKQGAIEHKLKFKIPNKKHKKTVLANPVRKIIQKSTKRQDKNKLITTARSSMHENKTSEIKQFTKKGKTEANKKSTKVAKKPVLNIKRQAKISAGIKSKGLKRITTQFKNTSLELSKKASKSEKATQNLECKNKKLNNSSLKNQPLIQTSTIKGVGKQEQSKNYPATEQAENETKRQLRSNKEGNKKTVSKKNVTFNVNIHTRSRHNKKLPETTQIDTEQKYKKSAAHEVGELGVAPLGNSHSQTVKVTHVKRIIKRRIVTSQIKLDELNDSVQVLDSAGPLEKGDTPSDKLETLEIEMTDKLGSSVGRCTRRKLQKSLASKNSHRSSPLNEQTLKETLLKPIEIKENAEQIDDFPSNVSNSLQVTGVSSTTVRKTTKQTYNYVKTKPKNTCTEVPITLPNSLELDKGKMQDNNFNAKSYEMHTHNLKSVSENLACFLKENNNSNKNFNEFNLGKADAHNSVYEFTDEITEFQDSTNFSKSKATHRRALKESVKKSVEKSDKISAYEFREEFSKKLLEPSTSKPQYDRPDSNQIKKVRFNFSKPDNYNTLKRCSDNILKQQQEVLTNGSMSKSSETKTRTAKRRSENLNRALLKSKRLKTRDSNSADNKQIMQTEERENLNLKEKDEASNNNGILNPLELTFTNALRHKVCPFPYCSEIFNSEEQFLEHKVLKHQIGRIQVSPTELQKYDEQFKNSDKKKCPICYRSITRTLNWKRHLKTHSSEKDYACSICKRTFSRIDHMQSHEKRHLLSVRKEFGLVDSEQDDDKT